MTSIAASSSLTHWYARRSCVLALYAPGSPTVLANFRLTPLAFRCHRHEGESALPYKFLSDEWVAEAKKVREEFAGKGNPPAHAVRMNQVITDVPFGDGTIDAHMDTSGGDIDLDLGHLDNPDLTVTLDYETAKAIIVDQNPQAGMQAFMAGKIKVQGDMTKLMAMQSATPDPTAQKVAERIKEITE